jgi:hypothetical protein
MKLCSESSRAGDDQGPAGQSQSSGTAIANDPEWTRRWPGLMILLAGWLIPQFVLLGPALIGRTVDLPVDLLAAPNVYLPARPEYAKVVPYHGNDLLDLLLGGPATFGDFAAKELRAGRLPVWQPSNFAGAPFVPIYSPFVIPYYIAPHPITLGWIALFQAITVGVGMWLLLRRTFHLSYWPAAIGSWCVPLAGFMTVWHGYPPIGPFCWLVWLLLAANSAVKNPRGYGSIRLALLTALALLSGHLGVSGLVLLTTGLYVLWLLANDICIRRQWQDVVRSALPIGFAWALGFLIAAPYLVPLLDYGRTGARMGAHSERFESRPPQGLAALPAILLPDVYGGNVRADWVRTVRTILPESASGAYAGLLAALWLAPLAWCDRRRRSQVVFLSLLVIVSLGWTLNMPGIVDILRSEPLRPLDSLSYNRWVLATSIALVILSAIGLEHLLSALAKFRWWFLIPMLATACFGGWCLYRRISVGDSKDQQLFSLCYDIGVGLSLAALVGWTTTVRPIPYGKWIRLAVIALLPLELFRFAWTERRQGDIALNYPPIPALQKLATLPPGRIWGVGCFPPNLNLTQGLEDVRGYDGVDPLNFIKLFELAIDKERTPFLSYARTQAALPAARRTNRGLKFHPVTDLLNVRYLIFRESPLAELPVISHEDDYWIVENRQALPRAYVPQSVQVVKDDNQALAQMARFNFDPHQIAFVTDNLSLPGAMRGTASVHPETATRTQVEVEMQTAGLVLLSDLWDAGWRAELDGAACPIHRVDVALRGFEVPAGKHRIVCIYDPQSVRTGFRAAAAGGLILLCWAIWKRRRGLQDRLATGGDDVGS